MGLFYQKRHVLTSFAVKNVDFPAILFVPNLTHFTCKTFTCLKMLTLATNKHYQTKTKVFSVKHFVQHNHRIELLNLHFDNLPILRITAF